jgi:signal transduction histidine kinase
MKPSLVRRLTIGFVLAQGTALMLALLALGPISWMDEEDQIGPYLAITLIADDIRLDNRGRLAVPADSRAAVLVRSNPHLWFVARGGGRELDYGEVPPSIEPFLRSVGDRVADADLVDIGARGVLGEASAGMRDTEAGRLVFAAGGIEPSSISFTAYLRFMFIEDYYWIPLMTAALTLLGALLAIPIVLRSLRPTTKAAAALNSANLEERLPEHGVVKELLPLVRAFNGALGRLEEGFERRRRFIADVAHELRTPVAVLNMHVDALSESRSKPDLQRTIFRLGQMIGQMLDAERLALSPRKHDRIDLVEIGRAAVAEVAPLAVANGYEIGFSAGAQTVIVEGDPYAISRAVANLLGNAIAHGGGSGTIELRVHSDGRVDVADEGPGIPAEARERIFEPFRRERWDRDGCGLGLHLVREIMYAHGGEVCLVGSGPGAIFRLDFGRARTTA